MQWERDVPLSRLTRYGIGGPAARLGRAGSRSELREALAAMDGAPYRVLGGGANLLVADDGVAEAVLVLGGEFTARIERPEEIEAGAAVTLPALVGSARRGARTGFTFLEAVPGTVGGGLRMNAGSRDVWLWHRVRRVEAMRPDGSVERLYPADVEAGYREVDVPLSWIFLAAIFDAPLGNPERIRREHREFREKKVASQVYDLPSVGSTWKNPGPGFGSAWEVVDRVGMRGARRGDAQIAEQHANFIVNHGSASADDVLALMIETRRRAHEQLGVWLEPEVCLWGFDPERRRLVGAA